MPHRRTRMAVGVLIALSVLVAAPRPAAFAADNTPIGVDGVDGADGTTLTAVNDSGMAIGYSDTPDDAYAIAWTATDGVTKILSPLGTSGTNAQAVNATGQVVGNYNDGHGHPRPFVWTKDGGSQDLGFADAQSAFPVGENDEGQIIVETGSTGVYNGYVGTPGHWTQIVAPDHSTQVEVEDINADGDVAAVEVNGSDRAFLWSATQGAVDIGTIPGSTATDVALGSINDADVIVGHANFSNGGEEPFRWTPGGGMTTLDAPAGSTGLAKKVNADGVAMGEAFPPGGGSLRGYVWATDGTREDLGDLGQAYVDPQAIADDGRVVGPVSGPADDLGFVWTHDTGMVQLAPRSGDESAYPTDVSPNGRWAVGQSDPSSGPQVGAVWDLDAALSSATTPSAPRDVQAVAGDGSALVSWQAPTQQGGARVTSYVVKASPGGATSTVSVSSGSADASTTVSGLTNGTAYTFTVQATNSAGPGDVSDLSSPAVTPVAGSPAPVTTSGTASNSGGTVSTGDHSTSAQPISTSVTVPSGTGGGSVDIAQGAVNQTAPSGYTFASQQVQITAPSASFDNALKLSFTIGASQAGGATAATLQLFRAENGGSPVQVPDCTATDGTATPDPCISSRQTGTGGEIDLTVLTSSASTWNFATKKTTPPPPPPHYSFTGFYSPVANAPKVNTIKAGAAEALSFSLNGNHGTAILAHGFPESATVSCAHPTQITGKVSATSGSLSYSTKTKRYTYTWKTTKTYAGTCRGIDVRLNDNTDHYALFHFTK
jgi:hypothetical protein